MGRLALVAILLCLATSSSAHLSTGYYLHTCPNLSSIVRSVVQCAVTRDARAGATLLRIFYHDCFVNGCDASLLLDDTSTFTGEKTAAPNRDSQLTKVYHVVDEIKTAVENACPGVVSCADILALAAMNSVSMLGGPSWTVLLGRRDSLTASISEANSDLPAPSANLSALISSFAKKNLSTTDMIALSGAHTIGRARCLTFRKRIYNDTSIDASLATSLQANCPKKGGDNNTAPLDIVTSTVFDTDYYKNLMKMKGVLHSDQELFDNRSARLKVKTYASNSNKFFSDFTAAMTRMGNISPLTGPSGEIRLNCRKIN